LKDLNLFTIESLILEFGLCLILNMIYSFSSKSFIILNKKCTIVFFKYLKNNIMIFFLKYQSYKNREGYIRMSSEAYDLKDLDN